MSTANKSFLLISRSGPYGSAQAREALDIALAGAAFNQTIDILFMDDGVLQLLPDQDPTGINQKNLAKTLPMLKLYDVANIYVEQHSLAERGLLGETLVLDCTVIDSGAAGRLIAAADMVLGG